MTRLKLEKEHSFRVTGLQTLVTIENILDKCLYPEKRELMVCGKSALSVMSACRIGDRVEIKFPQWVAVTECETRTHSFFWRDRHGLRRNNQTFDNEFLSMSEEKRLGGYPRELPF